MKKTYLNPQTEMHEVQGAALMQAASPGYIVTGGDINSDPAEGL